jgi:hypothetical protein
LGLGPCRPIGHWKSVVEGVVEECTVGALSPPRKMHKTRSREDVEMTA